MLKRHAIQVLRRAGHTLDEIAEHVAVGKRSVQRVIGEPEMTHHDTEPEGTQRAIGRPSKAEAYRTSVAAWLTEEPHLLSVELLRRAKLAGYDGAKSALYELVRTARPRPPRPSLVARVDDRPRAPRPSTHPEVPQRRPAPPGSRVGAVRRARRSHIGSASRGDDPPRGRPDDPRRGQTGEKSHPDRTRAGGAA